MRFRYVVVLVLIVSCFNYTSLAKSGTRTNKKKGNYNMVLVPGKSLGDISIGETRGSLVKKGFVLDEIRDTSKYLKKENILVVLEDNRAVQIWFESMNLSSLSLRGQKFPNINSPEVLRNFFKDCEPEYKGSGGILIYCENRGVELAYSFSKALQGLSVVTPAVANLVVGPRQKK